MWATGFGLPLSKFDVVDFVSRRGRACRLPVVSARASLQHQSWLQSRLTFPSPLPAPRSRRRLLRTARHPKPRGHRVQPHPQRHQSRLQLLLPRPLDPPLLRHLRRLRQRYRLRLWLLPPLLPHPHPRHGQLLLLLRHQWCRRLRRLHLLRLLLLRLLPLLLKV